MSNAESLMGLFWVKAPAMRSFSVMCRSSVLFAKSFATKRKLKEIKPLPADQDFFIKNATTPFNTDYQLTMNFLNRITKLAKIVDLKTETLETCKDTNHQQYEAMIKGEFVIPEMLRRLLKKEYSNLDSLNYSGE